MDVAQIAVLAFTSEDRVREVLHNFNDDGFGSLYPKYAGGRPPRFGAAQRSEIRRVARGRPVDYGLPFSTWSLAKLAEHLVAKGVVDDISHEGLRLLLREEGVSFQAVKTWKESNDPNFEAKKNRILELYDIADGKAEPGPGDPVAVFCMDEFGPLNLQPHSWAALGRRRRQGRGPPPGAAAPPAGDLYPSPWCAAPVTTTRTAKDGTATTTVRERFTAPDWHADGWFGLVSADGARPARPRSGEGG